MVCFAMGSILLNKNFSVNNIKYFSPSVIQKSDSKVDIKFSISYELRTNVISYKLFNIFSFTQATW